MTKHKPGKRAELKRGGIKDEEAKEDTTSEDEPVYMDHYGKIWRFIGKVKEGKELRQLCQQNWLNRQRIGKRRYNFRCKWAASSSNNRHNCKFRAVYLKKDGCLYTIEEHNHPIHH